MRISTVQSGAAISQPEDMWPSATRLAHCAVVDVRWTIPNDVPRALVDLIEITNRSPIHGAVVLGWSGLRWQTDRPALRPTSINLVTRTKFSSDAVVRMNQMSQDLRPDGWDGDECIVAFFGRTAVILGMLEHKHAFADVLDNELTSSVITKPFVGTLSDGSRLQDDPVFATLSRMFTANRNAYVDAVVSRWGRYHQTWWESRGGVGEVREVRDFRLHPASSARWEFTDEWVRAEGKRVRISATEIVDDPAFAANPVDPNATSAVERHYVQLARTGNATDWSTETVNGIEGVVDGSTRAFAATSDPGGDQVGDVLAHTVRHPELLEVIEAQRKQISELQAAVTQLNATVKLLTGAVALITTVTPGSTAVAAAGLDPVTVLQGNDPVSPGPTQAELDASRSTVFRVGT